MKKSIFILGLMSLLTFTVTSCGPSFCDCIKAEKDGNNSMKEPCIKKFKDISRSERKEMAKDCQN